MTTNTVVSRGAAASDTHQAARAQIEAINADARENWYDPTWRRQMLQAMHEIVWEGFQHENLLALYSSVESVEEYEEITIEEVRGLEVFWVSEGGNIEQSTMTERVWRLQRDFVGFHVSELIRKMRNGFARNQENMIDLAITQMDASINSRLFRTIQAAVPNGSPYYSQATALTLPTLNTMLNEVEDETLGEGVAIVGRAKMVNQIMDLVEASGTYAPETNEDIVQRGMMGRYRGAPIIKLKNHRDLRDVPFFPENEFYVIGTDASKVGFWGGLTSMEWDEQGGWYWHHLGRREAGFAVHHPERLRRFVDTDI